MKNPATQGSFERDPDFGAAVVVSAGAFIAKNISTLFSIFIWKEFFNETFLFEYDANVTGQITNFEKACFPQLVPYPQFVTSTL